MKITTTTKTLDLTPDSTEFEYQFAWNKKRGVDKDYWFTPTGKCKIWIGGLHTNDVGKIDPEICKQLGKQLKKNKVDTFKWGSDYYTIGTDSILEILNMNQIMYKIQTEWDKRKYPEMWVEDNRPLNF